MNNKSAKRLTWNNFKLGIALLSLLLAAASNGAAQSKPAAKEPFRPEQMDTVLYGAAYYPEYMPYERTDEDIALMKKAGISVVRIGNPPGDCGSRKTADSSTRGWTAWSKSCTRRESASSWGRRRIPFLHGYIRSTPKSWSRGLAGNTCTTVAAEHRPDESAYRFYCERVIRKIMEHYKDNPAIIGYQIDNETSSAGAANKDVQEGFRNYLKAKFKTTDELNRLWGLNYWGQRPE